MSKKRSKKAIGIKFKVGDKIEYLVANERREGYALITGRALDTNEVRKTVLVHENYRPTNPFVPSEAYWIPCSSVTARIEKYVGPTAAN